jgi:DNA-damage-inducible protein J
MYRSPHTSKISTFSLHKHNKSAMVNTRINPKLKAQAESIFNKIGLTSAEAVRLFYAQVCLHKGLPFEGRIPNKATVQAMKDADAGRTYKAENVAALLKEILS